MSVNNENSAYNQGVSMSQVNSAIAEATSQLATGYTPKGEATVATLNGLTGQQNGWLYTLTDAGTLTDGSLAVVAGDSVAWDDTNSVWYKAMNYAPAQYGTNEVHNLSTSITAFRTGDVIPVDGPDGTAKMEKDDLLQVTAENALAGNIAPAFDATRDNTNPYKAGEHVIYEGKEYIFVASHYGAWNTNDVKLKITADYTETDSDYIHENLGVFKNLLYMKTASNWFSASYSKDWKVRINYAGTDGTIYFKWDYEHIRHDCVVDFIILSNDVTLNQMSVTPLNGTAYSIKTSKLIKASDNVVEIAVNFVSSSNLNTLGDLAVMVAGDKALNSPLLEFNAIKKINNLEAGVGEINAKLLPPLVESEGRIYDNCTFTNVNSCAFANGVKHYFGKKSKKVRLGAWARFTITNFTHKVGERCGVMIWIDPALVKMDYQNESAVGQKIASFDVLFKSGGTTIQSLNMVYYDLNNGWNFIQSDVLASVIDTIQVTGYANLSNDNFYIVVDGVVCGRETKPVIAVSYDGIYASSDTIGVYAYHDSQIIPATIFGAEQYGQNDSFVTNVKKIHERGIFEIGSYGSAAQKATYDEAVTQAQLPKKTMNGQKLDATDVISVGCAHGACCTTVENLYKREGFKVFRALTCFGQNVMDDANGLRKCPSIGVTINSASWDADKDAALVATIKTKIDNLIANGDWAALVTHQIVNRADVTEGDVGLACTWEAWQEILDYIKAKETAGELTIMNIGELWRKGSYSEIK